MFNREDKVSSTKLTVIQYSILAVFLFLAFGLWRLQVSSGDKYEVLADQNRIRKDPVLAPRGKILDREGRLIVDNYPSNSVMLVRQQAKDLDKDLPLIAEGLHMTEDDIRFRLRRFSRESTAKPIFIKDDAGLDEIAFIEAHRNELPELEYVTVGRRLYPRNGFMAHVIGYVGEVSEEMLNLPQFQFYESGDIVGKSGVEQSYNDLLMGKNGYRRIKVNSKGKEIQRLSSEPAVPGKPLKLTIDLDVQSAAEEALGDKSGAVVAMDPRNGEILAMVSRPTFDPNDFAVRISREEWNRLLNDEGKPLLNKAIQAQLAPGSVFKIIMSVAGWQEGIAQNLHVNCAGGGTFYGRYFKCWVIGAHFPPHGPVDLTKGIFQSCDVFFYTLAERLGIGKIAKYATALGLGQKTGIDLPQEVSGTMPSEEWKARLFKQKWYAGEVISVGIGQGAVATSPIQLARAIGAIASGGRLVHPHVVVASDLPPPYEQTALEDKKVSTVNIDPKGWETITDAMSAVLNPGGTAPTAHLQGVDFAGKTGSAQVVSNSFRQAKGTNPNKYKDNSWFVGVSPRRNPEIVVAVLFEGGEHGKLAARMAAQVVRVFVDKQRKQRGNSFAAVDPSGHPVQISGIWSQGAGKAETEDTLGDHMQSGTFVLAETEDRPAKRGSGVVSSGLSQASFSSPSFSPPSFSSPSSSPSFFFKPLHSLALRSLLEQRKGVVH